MSAVPDGNLVDCPNCHGEGVIVTPGYEHNDMSGMSVENPHAAHTDDCRWCDGNGKVSAQRAAEWQEFMDEGW